ncbi:MAG TPA: DUF937 domain-containing protein, partial [Candidatus Methylomirabilis sp.]|nr:DUF937 domain-containing protein [Candidatus Methylomirabilis sp.]
MNIVDVIKSQLGGEILGKLSSVIGESENKTETAVTAAVPGLLAVLAQLASSSSGADKVINSLKQVDTGPSGGLGDILSGGRTGPALEQGGSLLNILLGSGALPAILSFLSKFAGIASGSGKSLLSLLAPLILSTIAKQFAGRSLTAQALSSFFAEQKPNINAALPPGFSLANIPGFTTTTATTAPRPVASTAPAESSGLPGWLLPLVGLCLLGALAWYFFGGGQHAVEEKPAPVPAPVVERKEPKPVVEPVVVKREEPKHVVEPVVPKVELPAVPDPTKIGTDLGAIYTSLTDLLGGIKDVPTAEAAIPSLTDLTPKIDGLQ